MLWINILFKWHVTKHFIVGDINIEILKENNLAGDYIDYNKLGYISYIEISTRQIGETNFSIDLGD